MAQTERLMSKSAYAKRRGVSPSVVTSYLKTGKITEKDGKIDWKAADKVLDSVLSKTNGGRRTPKAAPATSSDAPPAAKKGPGAPEGNKNAQQEEFKPGSMAAIRIAREQLSLDKQRVDFEAMTGVLVNRQRAENVFRRNIEAAVKILERFPDKMAPRLAVESDEFTIRKFIRGEVVELCKELANIADSFPESLTGEAQ